MMFRSISYFYAPALTAVAVQPADIFGQQKLLQDPPVGIWIPTAHETTFQDGGKRQQFDPADQRPGSS